MALVHLFILYIINVRSFIVYDDLNIKYFTIDVHYP